MAGLRETPIDWTVVSPLAKGSDRIVAHAVLDQPSSRLRVVTPFPVDTYRQDFHAGSDRQEFEDLLSNAETTTELHCSTEAEELDWSNPLQRSQGYFDVGRYVVDASEILIAIWDGNYATGFGGTGDIVRYAISAGRRVIWIDSNEPNRPACMLVPDATSSEPFVGARVNRVPDYAKDLSIGYHRLAAYNRDPLISQAAIDEATAQETSHLRQQALQAGLPQDAVTSVERTLLPLYTRADVLAVAYQRLYMFGAKALFRLSAFAVTIAVLQLLFFPGALWIIVFEVFAMLAAVLLLRVSQIEAWQEKWLNDRHMAEWLRTASYTAMLGVHHKTETTPIKLSFYDGPEQWFVETFRDLVADVKEAIPPIEFAALQKYLVDQWITQQAAWHRQNAERKKRIAHFYHRLGIGCFCLTFVMASLHLFSVGHRDHGTHQVHQQKSVDSNEHAHDDSATGDAQRDNRLGDMSVWISFFAVILPAWGASIHAIASLLDYDRVAEHSERMAQNLERLAERCRRPYSREALAAEIHHAEAIMAVEVHEWAVSLKFRELVLPS